ncbi:MAG: nitroreductase [Hamadaea sp.]|uniref:Acg family FMN-binding oxidoreductase n=1 Tax=Hamadaea sp. TaxID=2024425 RepID=UPI001836378F|nr:nitroreductase [Hamadaea sp.]NUR69391.1 nitroreductase [Hamadaea sp.]NUT23208.1 nitroreductase [Hamadaea sp.]
MAANPKPDAPVPDILAHAAEVASSAPSIHNSQPWRWEIAGDRLELYAERSRQLTATDPEGRMLTISCGASLHHARLALAGWGWQARVDRLPDGDGDRLAVLQVEGAIPITAEAEQLLRTIAHRHTDRRPVANRPVPADALQALAAAAYAEGARLELLRTEQIDDLASATAHAAEIDAADPAIQTELSEWAGGEREEVGIPDEVIPSRPPQTNVASREFAGSGSLQIGDDHDKAASYGLLFGDQDDQLSWLRGGEALSALWLTAVRLGLGIMPISEPVEVPAGRQILRRTLAYLGWPYLAVRVGVPADDVEQPATPRLPTTETIHKQ